MGDSSVDHELHGRDGVLGGETCVGVRSSPHAEHFIDEPLADLVDAVEVEAYLSVPFQPIGVGSCRSLGTAAG